MSNQETALDTPNVMQSVRGACARFCEARGLEGSHLSLLTMSALGRKDHRIAAALGLDRVGLAAAKATFEHTASISLEQAVEAVTADALSQHRR